MGSEWVEHKFEDLLSEPVRNGIYKKKEFHGRGVKIVNMGELFRYPRLYDIDMKRVELSSNEMSKSLLRNRDLIFARRSLTAEGAGKCSIVKEIREATTFESSIIRARPDETMANADFLYYYFSSPIGRHLLGTITRQVAVAGITGSDLKQLPVSVPPISEQRAVAHILGILDDKIELNRQMNTTLESMAQALFKSWFVDFDPVIDNALAAGNPIPESLKARAENRKRLGDQRKPLPQEVQQQFPSSFVFTEELGWIPEGWGIGCFGDVAQHIRNNVTAENVGDADFYIGLEHIGKKQLFLTGSGVGKSVESNKSGFQKRDLLFGKLRPYFHKVCLAPCEGICSTDILVFRAKQAFSQSYMTLTAFSEEFVDYANMRSTGTRMPRASAKDMLGYAVPIPNTEVLVTFEDNISPIWTKGMNAAVVSKQIEYLRNTLLPKLISGQLRLPDSLIDKFAEQTNIPDAEQITSEAI